MTFRITCLNNDCVPMDLGMWGEHGIAYLIEKGSDRILFDTGTSWEILEHNLKRLEIDLKDVSHVVLSHGHYDHTGGLMGALAHMQHPTLVADPLIFNKKFYPDADTGGMHDIGIPYSREQVEEKASLMLSEEPVELLPGITVLGRVPRRTSFEQTPENMKIEIDGSIIRDTLQDDRSIILDSGSELMLLCGCCHAGLVNTLAYVRELFPKPVHTITGGIHLSGAKAERIEKTIEVLRSDYQPKEMYFNHCTGLDATVALINAFGKQVKPCLVGTVLEF